MQLDEAEVRVLGALMEKEVATPEYYPLSVNALVTAAVLLVLELDVLVLLVLEELVVEAAGAVAWVGLKL